ncbi:MAG TPA: hypothetical protein VJR49_01790 [Chthoniobacterales bacterium]|nr:hypothetical protein [Chthoniobacterales bacterium]
MPKKKKTTENTTQPTREPVAPAPTKKTGKRQPPRRPSTVKKARKLSVTGDTNQQPAHISPSPQPDVPVVSAEPADDTVRLRAYFISERRRRFALPGDAESDWLEAKRQLLAEGRR